VLWQACKLELEQILYRKTGKPPQMHVSMLMDVISKLFKKGIDVENKTFTSSDFFWGATFNFSPDSLRITQTSFSRISVAIERRERAPST
jgi:hypothetical protein